MAGYRKLAGLAAALASILAAGGWLPVEVVPSVVAALVTVFGLFVGGNAGEHLAGRIGSRAKDASQ